MIGLLNWLKRPFPIGRKLGKHILISCLFGLFIFVFLLFFDPFPSQETETLLWLTSLTYGLITTIVMILNFILIVYFLKERFPKEQFTVGNALIISLWNIIIITIANWFYYRYGPLQNEDARSLLYFLGVTLSVGIFPVIILLFWFERVYFIRYSTRVGILSDHILADSETIDDSEIQLYGEGKTDEVILLSSHLICLKSEGNYVSIYHLSGELTKRAVLRGPLKAFEEQLADHPQFIRCHQSYIVNIQLIDRISGNTRAYTLDLKNLDINVPVSRQFKITRLSQS